MEFTVPSAEFRKAFSLVARCVNEKSPSVVIQSVLAVLEDKGLDLTASSYDTTIRYRIPVTSVITGGVLLPKRLMDGILSSCGDCELVFRTDGAKLHVSTPSANWTLSTQDPAAFPDVPGFDAKDAWTLDAASLNLLIARTAYLPNADQGGPMAGCLFDLNKSSVTFVATDKNCLASQDVSADFPASWPALPPIISVSFLEHTRAVLEADGEVHLGFPDQNTICVRNGATVIRGRLLEGRFPAWRDFVQEPKHVVTLPVDDLLRAVRQAAVCCSEESRGLEFSFTDNELLIGTQAHAGDSYATMPIQDGPKKPLLTVLDHRYVTDILKSCKGVETIQVGLYGSDRPVQFRTEDGLLAMISNIGKEG